MLLFILKVDIVNLHSNTFFFPVGICSRDKDYMPVLGSGFAFSEVVWDPVDFKENREVF